jgi:hypothetical protein
MTIYKMMLGSILLTSLFVFTIWLRVFWQAVKEPNTSITHSKLVITSIGLIINSLSILMVIICRVYNVYNPIDLTPFINACYLGMIVSDILFLFSASLGRTLKETTIALTILAVWLGYCGMTFIVEAYK